MKATAFLSACLFVFSASADYVWPTATTGKDGNMASNGADGWNGGMPNGTGTTWFYGGGTYTPYLDNGEELYLSGSVYMRNRSSVDESHVTLDISNPGTHLIFKSLQMGDAGDRADSSMKLYVHDMAKVSVTNSFATKGKNCFLDFRNGATFDISRVSTAYIGCSSGDWPSGIPSAAGSFYVTNTLTFAGSKMKGNIVYFGYGSSWSACPTYLWAIDSDFEFLTKASYVSQCMHAFTNCSHSVSLGANCEVGYGADVIFDGCAVTNGKWNVGIAHTGTVNPPDATLVFSGGTKARLQGLAGGDNAPLATGHIQITGVGTDVSMGGAVSSWGYTDIGKTGSCFIEVSDGASFRTAGDFASGMPFRLGVNAGSYGEFCLNGGECTMTNVYGVWIGCNGDGAMYVSSGTARFNRVTVGYGGASSYTKTALLRQTGGYVNVDNGGKIDNNGNNAIVVAGVARPSEVRLEGGVLEAGAIYSGNAASALLVGDGGTLRRSPANYASDYNKTKKFVYGLSAVQCGSKGLTIDTNGKDVLVDGDFTNKAGDDGMLVKTGAGVMSLADRSYDVVSTVVREGTLLVDGASSVLSTRLVVTNDAVFSLVGAATSVTLSGLTVDRGTIAIDPGDKIYVEGPVSVSRLRVEFSSLPEVGLESDFLVVDGELSAAAQEALLHALFRNAIPYGSHGAITPSYDSATGKTTVKIAVKADAPLSDSTQWIGSDGQWSAAGNWSDGLPGASKGAAFTEDSSSSSITLPSGAVAGALSFAGQGYALSGSGLSIPSEEGAAVVSVASGSHCVSAPVHAENVVSVVVETNSALAISGQVDGGGIKKSGGGKLVLGADNAFILPVSLFGGTMSVMTSGAIGSSGDSDNVVNLVAGTLEVTNSAGSTVTLLQDLSVVATNKYEPVIFKTDTDTVISSLSVTQGAILKHGKGRLTLLARDGRTLAQNAWDLFTSNGSMKYSGDGSVDPKCSDAGKYYYAPLTVTEGELAIVNGEAGPAPTETLKGDVILGRFLGENVAGDSSMTVDGVTLSMTGRTFYHGFAMSGSEAGQNTVFRLVNGARLVANNLLIGEFCFGEYVETLAATNATVETSTMHFSGMNSRAADTRVYAKDSTFAVSGLRMYSGGSGEFDNCSVGVAAGATLTVDTLHYTKGAYAFRNGSTLNVKAIANFGYLNKDFSLEFEDSTWKTDSSITLSSSTTTGSLSIRTSGAGSVFTIYVGEGAEFAFADTVPLTGDGGFRKAGAGTVSFGPGMYAATGTLSCEEGVLDLSEAGTLTGVTIVPGAGTIKGATFNGATIRLGSFGGDTPLFQDCTFTGRTKVVVGGTPACMEGATVARYSGSISGLSTFRLLGWSGYGGSFYANDGVVSVDVDVKGAIILVY